MTTPPPPIVPNFETGFGPQQYDWATLVTNPMSFFQQRMVLRVRQTVTGTSLPSSGNTVVVGFDTVDEDPYSGWNAGSFFWVPPYSGWFQVTITLFGTGNGNSNVLLVPTLNISGQTIGDLAGVVVTPTAGGAEGASWVYLVGGQDTVHGAGAALNAGGSAYVLSTTAGQQSSMEVLWLAS